MLEAYLSNIRSKATNKVFDLNTAIRNAPGNITVTLCREERSHQLGVGPERIAEDLPPIEAPFRIRKRGVETRIILNGIARPVDQVLVANIANARAWYALLKEGKTFADISQVSGTPRRRVQQMLALAFLAPDIVRAVMEGRQPVGFTSDWCLRHDLPTDWQAQRDLIATL